MHIKKVALIAVAIALVATGVALAKAVRYDLQPYETPSGVLQPNASGHLIANYDKDEDQTIMEMNVKGLKPNTEYTLQMTHPSGWEDVGTFTTNEKGNGTLHKTLSGDHSKHAPFAVKNSDGQIVLMGKEQ